MDDSVEAPRVAPDIVERGLVSDLLTHGAEAGCAATVTPSSAAARRRSPPRRPLHLPRHEPPRRRRRDSRRSSGCGPRAAGSRLASGRSPASRCPDPEDPRLVAQAIDGLVPCDRSGLSAPLSSLRVEAGEPLVRSCCAREHVHDKIGQLVVVHPLRGRLGDSRASDAGELGHAGQSGVTGSTLAIRAASSFVKALSRS